MASVLEVAMQMGMRVMALLIATTSSGACQEALTTKCAQQTTEGRNQFVNDGGRDAHDVVSAYTSGSDQALKGVGNMLSMRAGRCQQSTGGVARQGEIHSKNSGMDLFSAAVLNLKEAIRLTIIVGKRINESFDILRIEGSDASSREYLGNDPPHFASVDGQEYAAHNRSYQQEDRREEGRGFAHACDPDRASGGVKKLSAGYCLFFRPKGDAPW